MKQILKTLAAAALVVLAASCAKEQRIAAPAGEETTVEFTVATPELMTKAIADGNTVDKVACNVYSVAADGTETLITNTEISKTIDMKSGKATFSVRLVTGQTYSFLFWAYKDGAPYTLDAAKKTVTVSYTDAVSNDEKRDAFYAYVANKKITSSVTETVTLKRPFAQVNFGVNKADITAAKNAGIEVAKSSVKLTGVATELNLVKGSVSGSETAEFATAAIPAEDLTVGGTEYGYVAMNYVLVGKDAKSLSDATLKIYDGNDKEINTISVPNIPLQGNYRTNILGNLFTSDVQINVVVDPGFTDEELVDLENINCVSALEALFANGGSAKLAADLTLSETVILAAGKEVTLDLNGHNVNNTEDIWNESEQKWSLFSVRGGKLTIKGNGIVQAKENDCYVIDVVDGGEVTIEDGEFIGNIHAVYVYEGKAIVNGGKYSVQQTYPGAGKEYEYVLNCYDTNRAAGTASIAVFGGKFVKFNPANCYAEGANTNFCAEGYNSTETSTDVWTVSKSVVVKTASELKTMLTTLTSSGSGDNIVEIAEDIELAAGETWTPVTVEGYTGAGVITVKGNGHTIKGLDAPLFAGGFAGQSGVVVYDLTLDSSKINDSTNSQGLGAFIGCIDSMQKIVLNNCSLKNAEITSTGGARVGGLIGWTAGYDGNGAVDTYITIKNCTVENCKITAKGSVGALIGHAGSNQATYHTIEGNTVKNCELHSTDDGGWRVGIVVGTANIGHVAINNTTESGNTLSQDGKTAPTGQSNLYGRFVPGNTGSLTIDGVAVSQ